MKEIIESQEITFVVKKTQPHKQFFKSLKSKFDFGDIDDVQYDLFDSRIYVITSDKEYMVRLWDFTENVTKQNMTIRYSIFVD
jgi:hypothetical protein